MSKMAAGYICDRCGKVSVYHGKESNPNGICTIHTYPDRTHSFPGKRWDLCDDCLSKLLTWLKDKGEGVDIS